MKNFGAKLLGVTLLLSMSGCSHSPQDAERADISITPAITRVTGLNFELGDKIGLTITRRTGNYVENVPMTYNGSLFSAADLQWYATDETSTLTAYYPYVYTGTPNTFRVATDQVASCESSDLLSARKTNVIPSTSAISMVFRHLMTSVKIVLTNQTNSVVSAIIVGGTVVDATVDFATATTAVKHDGTATEIKAHPITPNLLYQAVVVPQTAALTITIQTADGKSRATTFASNTLLQGKIYTVELTLGKTSLTPVLSGEVVDWAQGETLKPNADSGDDDGAVGEGTMICQGETYNTVTRGNLVWMAENLRHIPSDSAPLEGVWYPNEQSDTTSIKIYGMLYNLTMAQRLCPAGWRIPTEADFAQLTTASCADFILCAGVYLATQNRYTQFDRTGFLVGATLGTEGNMYKYCHFTKGEKLAVIQEYPPENGVSVRYVRNLVQ